MRKLLLAAALMTSALMFAGVATAGAATVKVTAADLGTDWHTADTRPPGTGTFEAGPATPPLGTGSFELRTPDNTAKVQLFTDDYDGTLLADIDGIGYSTYRDPESTGFEAGVAALNIRVDLDGNGTADAYMVYEPYQDQGNAAVQTGVWQDWDAYRGGSAEWWLNTGAGGCGQATPCTWDDIVGLFPNASVQEAPNCGPGGVKVPCPGSLGVNQGSFNAGIVSNVDALYVSVNGAETTYDFDVPVGPPTSKDECKKGGWETFDAPRRFKNQGDCVSFVANGK
jgi:hypothetical protein